MTVRQPLHASGAVAKPRAPADLTRKIAPIPRLFLNIRFLTTSTHVGSYANLRLHDPMDENPFNSRRLTGGSYKCDRMTRSDMDAVLYSDPSPT